MCRLPEANTLPGMTALSLLPKSAAAVGISFPGLCAEIFSHGVDAQKKHLAVPETARNWNTIAINGKVLSL